MYVCISIQLHNQEVWIIVAKEKNAQLLYLSLNTHMHLCMCVRVFKIYIDIVDIVDLVDI